MDKLLLVSTLIFAVLAGTSCVDAIGTAETAQASSEEALNNHPGSALVNSFCVNCHANGINGAPIIGNKKMWGPRLSQGEAVLAQHAANGFGLMPAKGGRTELSEKEIGLAVNYMISRVSDTTVE